MINWRHFWVNINIDNYFPSLQHMQSTELSHGWKCEQYPNVKCTFNDMTTFFVNVYMTLLVTFKSIQWLDTRGHSRTNPLSFLCLLVCFCGMFAAAIIHLQLIYIFFKVTELLLAVNCWHISRCYNLKKWSKVHGDSSVTISVILFVLKVVSFMVYHSCLFFIIRRCPDLSSANT